MKPSTRRTLDLLEQRPEGITMVDALEGGAGSRLAARIADLEADGYAIVHEPITVPTRHGTARVTRYRLAEPMGQCALWGVGMSECARCHLTSCACRTGKTTVTVAGATPDEARAVAMGYLERRGWTGEAIRFRRRRTRLGMMGYRAWDIEFMVEPA